MVQAARRAVNELVAINEGLLKVGYAPVNSERKPLVLVMEQATARYAEYTKLELEPQAAQALVPASQFHLIIEELVRNAVKSAAEGRGILVIIRARIKRRWLLRSHLIIEVVDNGTGMDADVLKKATLPFFSTRAGSHVGLGLSGISDMIRSMSGRLAIVSTSGVGTQIKIVYPV